MGIIIRQTIKSSIYSYGGALIGFVNVALLMPHIFTTAEIGLTSLLLSVSIIFAQFGSLGFINITTRLFPYFRNSKNGNNGFLPLASLTCFAGFLLCVAIYYGAKNYLVSQNIDKSPLFAEYIYLLLPLIFFTIYYFILDAYNRVLYNASLGIFLKDFLLRILNLIGIGLFYFGYLDFRGFIYYYTLAFGVPTVLLGLYLIWKGEFKLKLNTSFIDKTMRREMINVGVFGLISGFSGIVVLNIDRYMVNAYLDLSATGIYATAFYFGTLIMLPGRSLRRIGSSIITQALKDNDYDTVKSVYAKSTLNMLIAAIGLFLLIWANEHNIFKILPGEFYDGRWVIFFIGLAQILNMIAGVSGEIIQFSKYYRVHALIMGVFITLIVVSNMILIPLMGIAGAALASAISYFIYDIIRFLFIYRKFGFQPYGFQHLIVIATGVVVYYGMQFLPEINSWIIDLGIRSALISILFGLSLYLFKVSPDMNRTINTLVNRFKRK
jgi:O-antigen/teichoic acid export membrane protein